MFNCQLISLRPDSFKKQFLVFLLAYILLAPPVALPLYQKLLFFPEKGAPVLDLKKDVLDAELYAGGCSVDDVSFQSSRGETLHGLYCRRPQARFTVLLSHGNGGNMYGRFGLARVFMHAGCSVLLYDYQGYGISGGAPTVEGVSADADSAYDYLAQDARVRNSIVLYGESLGGAVSVELSRHRPVQGIILQSTFPSLTWACRDRLWFTWLYPDSWFPGLDCLRGLSVHHAPTLLIHGDRDTIFPAYYSRVLAKTSAGGGSITKLAIVEGLAHVVEPTQENEIGRLVGEFIGSLE